jgi:hypothetical protein
VTSIGEENLLEDEDEEAEGAAGAAGAAVVCEPVAEAEAEAEAPGAAAVQAAAVQVAAVQVAEAEAGPMTADDVAESGGRGDGTAAAGAATTGAAATVPCGICGGAAPSPAEKLRRRRRRDLYPHESILVHEFAHCVMDVGLDDESRERIRAAHNAALDRATVSAESYMGSNASEYWAEATQAWFEASVRCDVNCGLNTRAELARCDPAIAAELERAFGPNDWRYPHTLARVAPRRAAEWARLAAAGAKLRGQWWHVVRPACMCLRVQVEASRLFKLDAKPSPSAATSAATTATSVATEKPKWRGGQPICTRCKQVIEAAAAGGLSLNSGGAR